MKIFVVLHRRIMDERILMREKPVFFLEATLDENISDLALG
ncbi:hypothetical protein [Okeania sp. SIO3I5]|nr:hypothetical protein [Okeania sp. SIO3I5]